MRFILCFLLALVNSIGVACQSAATTPLPALPKDAAEIFAAAAPLYDFASVNIKPFHLKASYQLYDKQGKPTATGMFEYWQAAPDRYKSTWKRPGLEYSEWVAGKERWVLSQGASLEFEEARIADVEFRPLPGMDVLNAARLDGRDESFGAIKLPCVVVTPKTVLRTSKSGEKVFPTYCFDRAHALLRTAAPFLNVSVAYDDLSMMQGRVLARTVNVYSGKVKQISWSVGGTELMTDSAEELQVPDGARVVPLERTEKPSDQVVQPKVLRTVEAQFPESERSGTTEGKVTVSCVLGTDGLPHDLAVTSATNSDFAVEALRAVMQYQLKPAMKDGKPVEYLLKIEVAFRRY